MSEDQPSLNETAEISQKERIGFLIELWKQTVAVQQHFNDLSWRIRGLALSALTITLGAAAVAAQKAVLVDLYGYSTALSALLTLTGLILWLSFFYVDLRWYHPLLRGSVKHGDDLEKALRAYIPEAGLTGTISEVSPYRGFNLLTFKRISVHSGMKLRRFYVAIAVLLIILTAALQSGVGADGETRSTGEGNPKPVGSQSGTATTPSATATTSG